MKKTTNIQVIKTASKTVLVHKILRTPRLIIRNLLRNRLLRNKRSNLDPGEPILSLTVLLASAERRLRRRELVQVVVAVVAATDDGGLYLGVCDCAGEVAATCAGGTGCAAAVAVAAG